MTHTATTILARPLVSMLHSVQMLAPRWTYMLRSATAATLAYGVAYWLQLDKPYSAASTVLLVANINHGAVLAKGGWRLIGTIIGGIAATIAMGLFIQTPALFLIFFGLWLGLCSAAATVTRHFLATGAAVAGYTMGFATYGALEVPENALSIVMGRVASVAVGVVCLTLVTSILSKRATQAKLEAALSAQLARVGTLLLSRLTGKGDQANLIGSDLITTVASLDGLLELSRVESSDVAMRAGAARESLAAMFGAILGANELSRNAGSANATLESARQLVVGSLPEIIARLEKADVGQARAALRLVSDLRRSLRHVADAAETGTTATNMDSLVAVDVLLEIVEDWESGIVGLVRLNGPIAPHVHGFRFHRDWRGAARNGLRSAIGIVCAGALGMSLGWQDWPLMLLLLAPYSVLMAMTGNPVAGAQSFVKGTLAAIAPAYACAFLLLPEIQGFPLMILTMLPFWLVGLYATTLPRYSFDGLGYLVAFNTLVGASNPMRFDIAFFFNQAFGWVVAVIATLLVLKLVLPHNPRRHADAVLAAIDRDVQAVLENGSKGRRHAWEHLQHHRLAAIVLGLKGDDQQYAAEKIAAGLKIVHLGRAALRLRASLQHPSLPNEVREQARHALALAASPSHNAPAQLAEIGRNIAALARDDPATLASVHRVGARALLLKVQVARYLER